MEALVETGNGYALLQDDGKRYNFCKNFEHMACNWIIGADTDEELCTACSLNCTLNCTIPHLSKRKKGEKATFRLSVNRP